jgi:ABC-type multidrug transport system ATPase subunit
MALVNQVCDHVYVIDRGKQIFDGTTREVSASEIVGHAYLGEDIGVVAGRDRRPSRPRHDANELPDAIGGSDVR